MKRINILLALIIIVSISNLVYSQWSNNPAINLSVCDTVNDQVLVKISPTTDGGCYISWFDHRAGSYAVYLQRLNAQGNKQFAFNGLLISNNSQSSSLVDYDLKTDANNNAVIVFTDTRNGSTINPFAYLISPSGSFLWGNNGVSLSDTNSTYQANPKVMPTTDGNYVIAWIYSSTPNKIVMQKLNSAGVKQWGTPAIYITAAGSENFTYPDLVASDNNSVIMLWSGYSGSFISPVNYKLYSQKFSSSGTRVWNSTQDTVYYLAHVSGFYVPRIFSDGNNGAIYCWRDDRNSTNLATGYIQRKNSAGTILFPLNGSAVSTLSGNNHFDPVASISNTGETYVIWMETNNTQSLNGVYGQKFSATGAREWTDNGKIILGLNQNQPSNMSVYSKNGIMIGYYNEAQFGSSNNLIKAFMTDSSGNLGWGGSIITPGSFVSPKIRLNVTQNSASMSMLAWQDNRNDAGGIFAQNINFDGTFGNPSGIININSNVPDKFVLSQNYPNPFNPSTVIKFNIPLSRGVAESRGVSVQLKMYDILGKEVTTLVNQNLQPGSYEVTWDAANEPSGVYFYKLKAGKYTETKKMLLVK